MVFSFNRGSLVGVEGVVRSFCVVPFFEALGFLLVSNISSFRMQWGFLVIARVFNRC